MKRGTSVADSRRDQQLARPPWKVLQRKLDEYPELRALLAVPPVEEGAPDRVVVKRIIAIGPGEVARMIEIARPFIVGPAPSEEGDDVVALTALELLQAIGLVMRNDPELELLDAAIGCVVRRLDDRQLELTNVEGLIHALDQSWPRVSRG